MSNLWIRTAYGLLLAVVVALTVGFGVTMALPGPRLPDTPSLTFRQLQNGSDNQQDAEKLIAVVDRFYQDAYDFRRAYPAYQRNVLLLSVLLATVVGIVGIALPSAFNYLRLGLTLGAILILLFGANVAVSAIPNPAPTASPSITNLLAAGSPPGLDFAGRFLRFAASFVALLVILFAGLWRLTEWAPGRQPSDQSPASGAVAGGTIVPAREASLGSQIATQPPPEQVFWRRPDTD